uniref:Uncharacterized protein n=1 Tax=Anguilla anguilla TaxID=7936 RepID=A0A0E9UC79_ANGAN
MTKTNQYSGLYFEEQEHYAFNSKPELRTYVDSFKPNVCETESG